MSERLNLKLSVMGISPNGKVVSLLTLDDAIKRIKAKNYQPEIELGLIKLIKKQPNNTYELFFKNIYTHLKKLENKK